MSAPNIASLATVTGKTVAAALVTGGPADIVTNAAASATVVKINSIYVANVGSTATVNVLYYQVSDTTGYYLAKVVSVAAASTLQVLTKDAPIYLMEGDKLQAAASANSNLQIVVSYEIIA
jgi:hypothetical protein